MERLLALGSVVKVQLEDVATARLMIAGYLPKDEDTGRIYDYVTVLYPFGMQQTPAIQMIHQDQILEVVTEGYLDERAEAFTRELPELIGKIAEEARRLILESAQEEGDSTETKLASTGEEKGSAETELTFAREVTGSAETKLIFAGGEKGFTETDQTSGKPDGKPGKAKVVDPLQEFG